MGLTSDEIYELRAKRLSELLEFYNLNQAGFIKRTEYIFQASNVSTWINGKRKITEDAVYNILRYFPEINENWLLARSDYMLKDEAEQIEKNSEFSMRRFLIPIELLQASFDLVNHQNGTNIEPHDKEEIQTMIDKLVSYSDFLAYDYWSKHK